MPTVEKTVKIIGSRVAEVRKRANLSQAALAEIAGVATETISRIERGRYEPAVTTLCQIANALGTTLDHLAGLSTKDELPAVRGRPLMAGRLAVVASRLAPKAQQALLMIAKVLPIAKRPRRSPRRKSAKI